MNGISIQYRAYLIKNEIETKLSASFFQLEYGGFARRKRNYFPQYVNVASTRYHNRDPVGGRFEDAKQAACQLFLALYDVYYRVGSPYAKLL